MLLDDVMSELDSRRRGLLVDRLLEGGQSVITAAEGDLVPKREGLSEMAIAGLTAATDDADVDPGREEKG
jgi:recombinational DNA repair ATPase RecF